MTDRTAKDQGPRNGEIRAVNYVDGFTTPKDDFGSKGEPIPIYRHRIDQFFDGIWTPIKVYQEDGDRLWEVRQ
jgi:hypothetical protein